MATVLGLLALTRLIYATRDYGNGAAQIDASEQFGMGGRWRLALSLADPGARSCRVPVFVDVTP